jgi:hypothetical protein
MTADEVLAELSRRAWRFGAAVLMSPEPHVHTGGMKVGGYFSAEEGEQPILAVATGRDTEQWVGLLIHEYSHLTQWAEKAPVWAAADGCEHIDAWLAGKPVKGIKAIIASVQELEADCERRAIRLARELQAPINLEQYTRGANSYIHFHNIMAETRKWYRDGQGPYTNAAVRAAANPTLDSDFSKTPKALAALLRECI